MPQKELDPQRAAAPSPQRDEEDLEMAVDDESFEEDEDAEDLDEMDGDEEVEEE